MFNVPVLLIGFNRPHTTIKVFERIKEVKPKKLYISIDGPRFDVPEDKLKIEKVKSIFNKIDWECEVKFRFLETNFGCGKAVSSAISWAFEKEKELIILEDDCYPSISFFYYCENLLNKYKDMQNIFMISGNNYNEEFKLNESYTFSRIANHIWGWATWDRAWKNFSLEKDFYYEQLEKSKVLQNKDEISRFFNKLYKKFYSQKNVYHTWDFQWNFTIFSNNGLSIIPQKNLVKNIGLEGTHTTQKHEFHNLAIDENFKIKVHPTLVKVNEKYDYYHLNNHWKKMINKPFNKRFKNLLRRIF